MSSDSVGIQTDREMNTNKSCTNDMQNKV